MWQDFFQKAEKAWSVKILVINVPVVDMARYQVILMRETSISRVIRRDGP
jgi:hypothetical protein